MCVCRGNLLLVTGIKFFQKKSPKVGILHGKDEGCGRHGSYGLLGSHHYEFDFTRWDGQVCTYGFDDITSLGYMHA